MPKSTLTNTQIIDLANIIKESGSRQHKAKVIDQVLILLEDIVVSDEEETAEVIWQTAEVIWQVYRYGESKLPVESKKKRTGTKVEIARSIMEIHYGELKRKEIIEMFMGLADLTEFGSATYYSSIKKEMDSAKNSG